MRFLHGRPLAGPGAPPLRLATDLGDSERRLLFAEVAETPWGLTGLEIALQRAANGSGPIEIAVCVAFDQPADEPVYVTLHWANYAFTSALDERGCARFSGDAAASLLDAGTGQSNGYIGLSLSSTP